MTASDHLGGQWHKGIMRLSDIPHPGKAVDQARVNDYATRATATMPPIELQDGRIMNGRHRYAALVQSGQDTAPVVTEGSKPPMVSSRAISQHEFESLAGYTQED